MSWATKREISKIIAKEAAGSPKTAKELAEAAHGLCSKHHIANSATWSNDFTKVYNADDYENRVRLEMGKKTITKTRHFIEVDDNGEEIGRVDMTHSYHVLTYKAI